MSKTIRITESQLKTLIERKHSYKEQANEEVFDEMEQLKDGDKEDVDVEEVEVNESLNRIKSNFKRFL